MMESTLLCNHVEAAVSYVMLLVKSSEPIVVRVDAEDWINV